MHFPYLFETTKMKKSHETRCNTMLTIYCIYQICTYWRQLLVLRSTKQAVSLTEAQDFEDTFVLQLYYMNNLVPAQFRETRQIQFTHKKTSFARTSGWAELAQIDKIRSLFKKSNSAKIFSDVTQFKVQISIHNIHYQKLNVSRGCYLDILTF